MTAAPLSAADKADLGRLSRYLNLQKTLEARFMQFSSNGGYAEGALQISRPDRMNLEYDAPSPVRIVADGHWLIFHDSELNQTTHIPLGSTPAGILLGENITFFAKDLTVTGFEKSPGALRVSVVRRAEPLEGSLTLVFSDAPLGLRKWSVTDAQGIVTTVSLVAVRTGVSFAGREGLFKDPSHKLGGAGD